MIRISTLIPKHQYDWPSREEWAKRRRTVYADMTDDLCDARLQGYATQEQVAEITFKLKEIYRDQGRKMREAKPVYDTLRIPGEQARGKHVWWLHLSRADQDRCEPYLIAQCRRKGINRLLRDIADGNLSLFGDAHYWPEIFAPFVEAYDAARDAALKDLRARVAARPIDDAAWEKELRWRASIESDEA
jgi:hypothetical protein